MGKVREKVFSRPPMERMMRVHQMLHEGLYPNCTTLAGEFEVSPRTMKRDIDFMKCRLGLPISFDVPRKGFYYTRLVNEFPPLPVSEAEVFALLVAHKAISQYRGTPFQQPLEAAFRRLTGQLDQSARFSPGSLDKVLSFRPFAPEDADLRAFEAITRAIRESRGLIFSYRNHGAGSAQPRHVHPYHLACIDNRWCLFAFDVQRQDIRTFVLARLSRPRLTAEHFAVSKTFDANAYLNRSLGAFKGAEDYEVVLEVDAWAADEVRGRRWHSSQELTELPGRMLRMRLRLDSLEEVEKWVLSMGAHVTVIRPRALAERLAKVGRELASRYGSAEQRGA